MNTTTIRARWYGVPIELQTLWTSSKGSRTARLVMFTHQLGWELKIESGDLLLTQVCRSDQEIEDVSAVRQSPPAPNACTDVGFDRPANSRQIFSRGRLVQGGPDLHGGDFGLMTVTEPERSLRVAPDGAAPRGAQATPVTSALRRAPRGAVRRQDPRRGAEAIRRVKVELWQ